MKSEPKGIQHGDRKAMGGGFSRAFGRTKSHGKQQDDRGEVCQGVERQHVLRAERRDADAAHKRAKNDADAGRALKQGVACGEMPAGYEKRYRCRQGRREYGRCQAVQEDEEIDDVNGESVAGKEPRHDTKNDASQ